MKASNFSDAQKAFIIKQGEDGTPVAEICRKAGISQTATILRFRSRIRGGAPASGQTGPHAISRRRTRNRLLSANRVKSWARFLASPR